MAKEYTRREPSNRESTITKVDNTKSVDQRNIEAKVRSAERKAQKAAGEAALGGMTLSEALRTPAAQRSTKVRRQIKKTYEQAKLEALDPFAPKSSSNLKPIGKGSLMAQSVIIVVDGFIEEIDIIVGQ